MTILKAVAGVSAVAALTLTIAAPTTTFASQQGRNTLTGGLVGAGAGAVLTHGSVGGALIGNAVSSHRKHYNYSHRHYHRGY